MRLLSRKGKGAASAAPFYPHMDRIMQLPRVHTYEEDKNKISIRTDDIFLYRYHNRLGSCNERTLLGEFLITIDKGMTRVPVHDNGGPVKILNLTNAKVGNYGSYHHPNAWLPRNYSAPFTCWHAYALGLTEFLEAKDYEAAVLLVFKFLQNYGEGYDAVASLWFSKQPVEVIKPATPSTKKKGQVLDGFT